MLHEDSLKKTDPEFMERWKAFACDEVVNEPDQQLDDPTRYLAIMAALTGSQSIDAFKAMLPEAMEGGLTPVMLKEMVYQAVDYLGFGRVYPFLNAVNDYLKEQGVELPLEGQATTTMEDRLEKGAQAQVDIFGDVMKDYYTRTGLDYKQREMITFCFLAAQGGCEPQLTSHAGGNMMIGNDKAFLIKVVSQCLPYIGYPRSLNAMNCIENAAKAMEK